jgi:hypothetical protein
VSIALAPETGSQLALLLIEWPSGWPIWETSGARIRVQALGVSLFVPGQKNAAAATIPGPHIGNSLLRVLNLQGGTGKLGSRPPPS